MTYLLMTYSYAGHDAWIRQDGRVLYLLPWEGSTIAGTTGLYMHESRIMYE